MSCGTGSIWWDMFMTAWAIVGLLCAYHWAQTKLTRS